MAATIIMATDETRTTLGGRRLRARRVDEQDVADRACAKFTAGDRFSPIEVQHGGGVANAYKYPAETECVLAVAVSPTVAVVWARRKPANKVSLAGAAGPEFRDVFDARVSPERREAARLRLLCEAHLVAGVMPADPALAAAVLARRVAGDAAAATVAYGAGAS